MAAARCRSASAIPIVVRRLPKCVESKGPRCAGNSLPRLESYCAELGAGQRSSRKVGWEPTDSSVHRMVQALGGRDRTPGHPRTAIDRTTTAPMTRLPGCAGSRCCAGNRLPRPGRSTSSADRQLQNKLRTTCRKRGVVCGSQVVSSPDSPH